MSALGSGFAKLLLKGLDNGKPKKILAWAHENVKKSDVKPDSVELRLVRKDSGDSIHAVLLHSNGNVIATDSWSFIHSRPEVLKTWFHGSDHSRMKMHEAIPQPFLTG